MYVPPHYRNSDQDQLIAFIRSHSFGILVSNGIDLPAITHLPFAIESEQPLVLSGHLAKSNPHAVLLQPESKVTVVFSGPHAYVSPGLYNSSQNVPTWNYIAVHAHGKIELCDDAEKEQVLRTMISEFEPGYAEQFSTLPDNYLEPMKKAITAFKVHIDLLDGKFKLSQNKTKEEQERIRAHFANDGKNDDLAHYM